MEVINDPAPEGRRFGSALKSAGDVARFLNGFTGGSYPLSAARLQSLRARPTRMAQEDIELKKKSPEHRARISRGLKRHYDRLRAQQRILPSDLRALRRRGGPVRRELRPLIEQAGRELEELLDAVGGETSPQRQILAQDVARIGLLVRALFMRFVQTEDEDIASKMGTLVATRRAGLQALGLDREIREIQLDEYLREKATQRSENRGADDIVAGSSIQAIHEAAEHENGGARDPEAEPKPEKPKDSVG
jgi:hypothetical protein